MKDNLTKFASFQEYRDGKGSIPYPNVCCVGNVDGGFDILFRKDVEMFTSDVIFDSSKSIPKNITTDPNSESL